MSYTFYPGCSLEGTAKDFHRSTLAVAAKVGLEMPELEGWICCGSTAAHNSDPLLADALPARNLRAASGQDRGGRLRGLLQPAEDGQSPYRAATRVHRARVARRGGERLRRADAGPPSAGDTRAGSCGRRWRPPCAAR